MQLVPKQQIETSNAGIKMNEMYNNNAYLLLIIMYKSFTIIDI